MMTKVAVYEREVANVVEIVGENLMVDVRGVQKMMLLPTMKIPLNHVMGAEADPEIQRKYWKAWILPRASRIPEPGVKFYNPRLGNRQKAIVIWLKEEVCERLVVEVQDPSAIVEMINQVVEASTQQ
jgi:hypothetical protein